MASRGIKLEIELDERTHRRLRAYCTKHGISEQEFIERATSNLAGPWGSTPTWPTAGARREG